ncbi:MAG: DUF3179 domain-containing protein [Planctomycetes bacterium]|nr:DUF3179 domain-containing protein [Planctomycetota bacterium]
MYSRRLDGRTLTFGHEGILYKNSFVMYDKETKSLWIHTLGEAVKGPLKGKQLEFIPSFITTWKAWRTKHPETLVLTGRRARGMMGAFNLGRNPDRYGLSVGQGRETKLYPYSLLHKRKVIHDDFEGKKIVVAIDADTMTARAFECGDRKFRWSNGTFEDETGKAWDLLQGAMEDERLRPLPATPWLIERWRAFYPGGAEYESE